MSDAISVRPKSPTPATRAAVVDTSGDPSFRQVIGGFLMLGGVCLMAWAYTSSTTMSSGTGGLYGSPSEVVNLGLATDRLARLIVGGVATLLGALLMLVPRAERSGDN